jgi:hypothetical protein
MALMFQVEVDYFADDEEQNDIIQVKEPALAQWLRDMASDIDQEGLKILGISIVVSGILPPV